MTVIPFVLAFGLGYAVFYVLHRRHPLYFSDMLIIFAAGIGLSAQTAFYQTFFFNKFEPWIFKIVQVLVLGVLFLAARRIQTGPAAPPFPALKDVLYFTASMAFFAGLVAVLLVNNPYGEWDAWAFWNMRARHVFFSGHHWKDIYEYGTQAKHPGLLTDWILCGWAWLGEGTVFPAINAFVCFILVVALLVFGLRDWTKNFWLSLLAGVFTCSIPYFLRHSCSQYADSLSAALLLSCVLAIMRFYQDPQKGSALWSGLLLGLVPFNKDDGILISLILLGLMHAHLAKKPQQGLMKFVYLSFIGVCIPTLMVKIWTMAVPNDAYQVHLGYLFNWQRWLYVIGHFCEVAREKMYGGVFLIPILLLFWRMKTPFDENARFIVRFFLWYFFLFFLLYAIVAFNLPWRLAVTSHRLIYQVLPLAMFLLFYCLCPKHDKLLKI